MQRMERGTDSTIRLLRVNIINIWDTNSLHIKKAKQIA